MANDKKVSLSYTKILALGPGQVGKSTFLYRLMGLMKGNIKTADPSTQPQSSTGIAELREACITYSSRTGALTSESWQIFDKSSDLQCVLDGLMSLLIEQIPSKEKLSVDLEQKYESQTVGLKPSTSKSKRSKRTIPDLHEFPTEEFSFELKQTEPQIKAIDAISRTPVQHSKAKVAYPVPKKSNLDEVIAEFDSIQAACRLVPQKTKFRMLLNIADIGGQPAFLEMLPSLTIGPALYLVFMKLLQGLTTRYPVAFKCKDGRGSKLCKNYTYTSEEVIFTALSSVASFGNSDEEVEQYVTNSGDNKQTSSLALLVGTFRDEIENEKKLDYIDHQLKERLEVTDFFNDGLIFSKSFLRVNNYSADKTEIENQRKLLEEILEKKFRKYQIPMRWLTLSIHLKLLSRTEGRHEVSFDDCVKLGYRLGMKREMVKVALQFLHKYIGLVMYFPKNTHLKNIVICDPQVVFSSISEIIFDIYDPRKMYITEAQHDHFVRTGCFSPQDITVKDEEQYAKNLLSVDTLVNLLLHLNIIAEVPLNVIPQTDSQSMEAAAKKKQYYFLPAVLQTAELSILARVQLSDEDGSPEPLCIRFQTGYLPLGFVCALSANLIAESDSLKLIPFVEGDQQITYKNKMKFRFHGKFDIIMVSGPKYCEFRVDRWSGTTEYWDEECCPRIKTIICEAADRVMKSFKHGSLYKPLKDLTYELAFRCPMHQDAEIGHEPLAEFVYSDLSAGDCPKEIQCVNPSCITSSDLSPQMQMWFGEVRKTVYVHLLIQISIPNLFNRP